MNIHQLNDALTTPNNHTGDNIRETTRRWLSADGKTRHRQIHLATLRPATNSDLYIITRYLLEHAPNHSTTEIRQGHGATFITTNWTEPTNHE